MALPAGDKKAGNVRILYDTTWSTRGVLQCTGRKPRPKDAFDFQVRLRMLCVLLYHDPDCFCSV